MPRSIRESLESQPLSGLVLDFSYAPRSVAADAGRRFASGGPSRTLRERFAHAVPKSCRHLGTVRDLFRLTEARTSLLKWSACADFSGFVWSGRRDSNPRPRPWQGRALPLAPPHRTIQNAGEVPRLP